MLSTSGPVSKWRMEVVDRADGVTVVNDAYNANPDSMRAAIEATTALAGSRRVWAVLGTMRELGDATAVAHTRITAAAAAAGVSELLAMDCPDYLPGSAGMRARLVNGIDGAADVLAAELAPGDVVLIKGGRALGMERLAARLLDGSARARSGAPR